MSLSLILPTTLHHAPYAIREQFPRISLGPLGASPLKNLVKDDEGIVRAK